MQDHETPMLSSDKMLQIDRYENQGMNRRQAAINVLGEATARKALPELFESDSSTAATVDSEMSGASKKPVKVTDPGNPISTLSNAGKATRDSLPSHGDLEARGELPPPEDSSSGPTVTFKEFLANHPEERQRLIDLGTLPEDF